MNAWLAENAPDYQNDKIYQQLRSGAPENIPQNVILAEYASLKWLGINRPDYKDVVTQTIAELKDEIVANRDAILGVDSGQASAAV